MSNSDEDLTVEIELFGERARRWRQLEVWHAVYNGHLREDGHRQAIYEADIAEWEMQKPKRKDYRDSHEFDEATKAWRDRQP